MFVHNFVSHIGDCDCVYVSDCAGNCVDFCGCFGVCDCRSTDNCTHGSDSGCDCDSGGGGGGRGSSFPIINVAFNAK